MRTSFYEYYNLSDKETDKLWKEGLIVFDTNVLLSLYRLSKEARDEILSVMSGYKSRIWLPHQVGYEYHGKRLDKANAPIDAVRGLEKRITDFENSLKSCFLNNPYVDYKKLDTALKSLKTKISKLSVEWLKSCPDMVRNDSVLDSLTKLFDGKIGEEFDETRLAEIYKEGNERYNNKIPPGYKDTKKTEGERHRFGDYIIWLQIIEQAKKENKDIIFVTEDCKEDWWCEYKDDKLGPRRELIREFRKETDNHLIWFYTTDRFLSYAKSKLGASIKPKTIDEVKRPTMDLASILGSTAGQVSVESIVSNPYLATAEYDPYRFAHTPQLFSATAGSAQVFGKQGGTGINTWDVLKGVSASSIGNSAVQEPISPVSFFSAKKAEAPTSINASMLESFSAEKGEDDETKSK